MRRHGGAIDPIDIFSHLGHPPRPRRITQPLFNVDRRALESMLDSATPDDPLEWHGLLQNFAEDLPHVDDIQPDLLRWLLPYVWSCWRSAAAVPEAWAFVDRLHAAVLTRPEFIRETLGSDVHQRVIDLVVAIAAEHSRRSSGPDTIDLTWHPLVVTLTAAWPGVSNQLWDQWSKDVSRVRGAAWSMLGYLAHLAWPSEHNLLDGPSYARWRPWQHASMSGLDGAWSDAACSDLRRRLTASGRADLLARCLRGLAADPDADMAILVSEEIQESDRTGRRVADLIELLALPGAEKWWPDELR